MFFGSVLGDKERRAYDADETLQLALAHLLQIVGEAARRVSDALRERNTEIPWKAMSGMRHKVVHDYMDVDGEIVWGTVRRELPSLVLKLEGIMGTEEPGPA